jgi:SP family general alpha glucoside:H+ symporter-like MFS transporter
MTSQHKHEGEDVTHVATREPASTGLEYDSELAIFRTLFKHPIILLLSLYANLGALMYGFDNITLSLCLSMEPLL